MWKDFFFSFYTVVEIDMKLTILAAKKEMPMWTPIS